MGGINSESAKHIVNNSTHLLLSWEDPHMCYLRALKHKKYFEVRLGPDLLDM